MTTKTNDIIEFTLLYNQNKKKLYNYVLKMVSDQMVCEDITQNVFMKLYENMDAIRNKNSIMFWVFTTARNEIYAYYRSKKIKVDQFYVHDVYETSIDSNYDMAEELEMSEMRDLILEELEKLPVEQKEVFYLREYGELSYKEISSLTGINETLVKSRLFKVRAKLINRISKRVID